jgi:hypothetical protein
MPATAVESSDNASGTIVGYLAPVGAPDRTRGLVLGYVQSGKTSNFTGGSGARRKGNGWARAWRHDMARISYDEQTATAFKAVREVPRDGLSEWREAVRRHLRPSQGMTLVDIGAGTGAFAVAFSDWFGLSILAAEPSAAMRAQIPRRPDIEGWRATPAPSCFQTARRTTPGCPS